MLSFKLIAKVAFLASLASSNPDTHIKRTYSGTGEAAIASKEVTADIGILNFALTLEHLEHQFYVESLHRFGEQDFRRANIPNPTQSFQNFHHILQHEAQHVKTLQTVITSLGGTPLPPCEYNFGVEDFHGFMALARILEKIGVSAYDGAVALLNNPDLQTAAATIDTVEARHSSFIATATGVDPFSEDFDVALSGDEIITLASAVILKCPFDIKSTLGAAPAGSLSLVAPHVVRAGREIKVKFDPGQNKPEDHFCGFLFSDKSVVVPLSSDFKCKVPRGCRGDIFVAILNKNEKLTLKNSVSIIAAGPIIVNVDSSIEDSCKKFVHGVDLEWQQYDLKHDKVYDVDVPKRKDYSGADAYQWKQHSEDDASKDHTTESKDSNWTHVSAPSYRKRGLRSSGSSRAELPLWSEIPNPEDAPVATQGGDNYGIGAESAGANDATSNSDMNYGGLVPSSSPSDVADTAVYRSTYGANDDTTNSDMNYGGLDNVTTSDTVGTAVYGSTYETTTTSPDAQVSDGLSPTPTGDPVSTNDDVISELRAEVARTQSDDGSVYKKGGIFNNLPEREAGLPADASDVVADLEAQLQKIDSQSKA